VVFAGAVLFLYLRRHVGREDPAVVRGPTRRDDQEDHGAAGAAAADPAAHQDEPTDPRSRPPGDTDASILDMPVSAGDGENDAAKPNATSTGERPGAAEQRPNG
jgi:hypothetical protein